MRVLQFGEDAGLLVEDGGEHLLGVGVVLGGKLDGVELPIKRSQFDPNHSLLLTCRKCPLLRSR